jgi:pimeloyl-ACP methyl ester carboxylesterase
MAQDVINILNHLCWDKVHVVGNSLGGMIAQELALAVPHRMLSLALIATHAGGWKSYIPPWQAVLSVLRHPFVKTPKDQTRVLMEAVFSQKFLALPGKKEHFSIINGEYSTVLDFYMDSLIDQFDGIFVKENPLYQFIQQLSAVLTHRVSAQRLETLRDKFPILLMVGTGDKIVHPSHTDFLHSVLGGNCVKFDGAGHAITEECLDLVNSNLHSHFCKVSCM